MDHTALDFPELQRVAHGVAISAPPLIWEDVEQEALLALWRNQPYTLKLAWIIARRARNRLDRAERRQAEIAALVAAGVPQALSVCDRRRATARAYYARVHPKTPKALRPANPDGNKYWRNPERYRETARLRTLRWRLRL